MWLLHKFRYLTNNQTGRGRQEYLRTPLELAPSDSNSTTVRNFTKVAEKALVINQVEGISAELTPIEKKKFIQECIRSPLQLPPSNSTNFAKAAENAVVINQVKGISEELIPTLKKLDISNRVVTPGSPNNLPSVGNKLMSVSPTKPIEVFFSYDRKDEKMRDELEKHLSILKRQGVITAWHNRKIGAGKEWQNEIDAHLNTASVILLLISTDFITSDYCWDVEVRRAMERHEAKEARVIPVILRSTDDWESAPFGKLKPLPKDGKPISKWGDRDEAFCNVALGIRAVVKELTASL